MKKIIVIASFILLGVLLTGCMSMFGSDEDTDNNEITEEETVEAEENEEAEKKEVDADPTESTDSSSDVDNTSTDEVETEECDEDYDVFLEELPNEFPMPECAIVGNVLVDDSRVDSTYETEDDWSNLYAFYKNYLGDDIEQQNQVLNENKGDLSGNIDGGKLEIEIKEIEDDYTKVRVFYRFP